MIGFVVVLMLLVGVPLLLNAHSRVERLEHRLRLVEEELRRRIAAGQELMREQAQPRKVAEPREADSSAVPETPFEPEPAPVPEATETPALHTPVEVAPPMPVEAVPLSRATDGIAWSSITHEVEQEPRAETEPASEVANEPPYTDAGHPRFSRASMNFEDLFGRKLPIWAGGITLAIAGVLIVKYAIDAGFFARVFTPGVQAVCGMAFGFGLIGGGEWAQYQRERVQDPRVSQALSGAGISTLYAALLVAANVYGLISPMAAFSGLALVTAGALWLATRHGMPSAMLGLAGGLAAPALTVGIDANVPMLATYLAFTIAGLVGVSRARRWPWLALMALAGGAGWSLWLVIAGKALTALGALSVGTFVLLLAIAIPIFAFKGSAATLLRAVSAIVGAVQLALLVAIGGWQPLHWGLFALIASAGQWLAWRNREFAIVPTLGAVLSALLLLFWPAPTPFWLATIGLALTAIHALPLLAKLWREPVRLQWSVELSAIAVSVPLVTLHHFHAPWGEVDLPGALAAAGGALLALAGAALGWKAPSRGDDNRLALLLGTGGALLSLAAWTGFAHWQAPLWIGAVAAGLLALSRAADDRRVEPLAAAYSGLALFTLAGTIADRWNEASVLIGRPAPPLDWTAMLRWGGLSALFALFAWRGERMTTRLPAYFLSAALAYGLSAQLVPEWTLPLAMGIAGAATMLVLQRREPPAAELPTLCFAAGAVLLLGVTGPHPAGEWLRLLGAADPTAGGLALLRWAGVAALGVLAGVRARLPVQRQVAQAAAALLGYGAAAQIVPLVVLPLIPAAGIVGLAAWSRRLAWPNLRAAIVALICVIAAWAIVPLVEWTSRAGLSLGGIPMLLDTADLGASVVVRRLLLPALALGGMVWLLRSDLSRQAMLWSSGLAGAVTVVAVHSLYRAAFSSAFGTDFPTWGLGERLLWCSLLLGAAFALWKRGGALASQAAPAFAIIAAWHVTWYSLLLHDPLWAAQAVGGLPAANLLLPLFAALPLCLWLVRHMRREWAGVLDPMLQTVLMVTVAMFAWASLRQLFHGTLLTRPGITQTEDILRSILGITLAVGYLLWGIRTRRHNWRIVSLMLLLAAVAKVFLFDASGLEGLLRIASFVALGFSLIGIGWLYSRQLRSGPAAQSG